MKSANCLIPAAAKIVTTIWADHIDDKASDIDIFHRSLSSPVSVDLLATLRVVHLFAKQWAGVTSNT